jgi:hypothetical protein
VRGSLRACGRASACRGAGSAGAGGAGAGGAGAGGAGAGGADAGPLGDGAVDAAREEPRAPRRLLCPPNVSPSPARRAPARVRGYGRALPC